ncbi:hypothetical protein [Falsihalocynthiibacter arcticus]|uniref:Uncharacterized protein n=1 Tax=Falsihalocynthiibacter arcticus TaxID=1579316 RepID=A0A126UVK6_9RHOB|nr:hypothetical protein [Falsihalocynthiibacter arcticus]AML50111.1 hypothetical protein RC74_01405 [Falsihalocynthiibacter arcticus]
MQRAFLVVFAFIALSMTFGFDFFQRQQIAKATGETYGVSEYFASAKARYAAFKNDPITYDIDDYAPNPADWEKRVWTVGDGDLFFGPQKPLTADQLAQLEAVKEVDNNPFVKLMQADLERGLKKGTWVYEKGDSMIALELRFIPARLQTMVGGEQLNMMQDMMQMTEIKSDFARVGGVLFQETTRTHEAFSRELTGHIGRQIDIVLRVIGPSSDILTLMADINFDGLNGMVETPIEGVGNMQEIAFLAMDKEQEAAENPSVYAAMALKIQAMLAARVVEQVETEQDVVAPTTEKPKVRRLGSGSCSGSSFKRCVARTN